MVTMFIVAVSYTGIIHSLTMGVTHRATSNDDAELWGLLVKETS